MISFFYLGKPSMVVVTYRVLFDYDALESYYKDL